MNPKLKSRLYLLCIFAACAAPVVFSLLTYYVWKPAKLMNYGAMLEGAPLALDGLRTSGGAPLDAEALRGKWVLLLVDSPRCAEECVNRLYVMRQTALAMEMKKDKLAQAWVFAEAGQPSGELTAQYPRTLLIAGAESLVRQLPQPASGHIFLLDPGGKPFLRYPPAPDGKRMMKDLGRLLDIKRM